MERTVHVHEHACETKICVVSSDKLILFVNLLDSGRQIFGIDKIINPYPFL